MQGAPVGGSGRRERSELGAGTPVWIFFGVFVIDAKM